MEAERTFTRLLEEAGVSNDKGWNQCGNSLTGKDEMGSRDFTGVFNWNHFDAETEGARRVKYNSV